MCAACVRVVDTEDIAWMDVITEFFEYCLALEVQRSDVDGNILVALHDGVAVRVAKRRREVAGLDDEGVAGAENLLTHEVDGGREGVLQNLKGNWIECAAPGGSGVDRISVM